MKKKNNNMTEKERADAAEYYTQEKARIINLRDKKTKSALKWKGRCNPVVRETKRQKDFFF